jgi:hypothetical protein
MDSVKGMFRVAMSVGGGWMLAVMYDCIGGNASGGRGIRDSVNVVLLIL